MTEYNWSDDSALWQARNGKPESPRTLTAWDYIESRLQGYDQALANARIDDIEPDEAQEPQTAIDATVLAGAIRDALKRVGTYDEIGGFTETEDAGFTATFENGRRFRIDVYEVKPV